MADFFSEYSFSINISPGGHMFLRTSYLVKGTIWKKNCTFLALFLGWFFQICIRNFLDFGAAANVAGNGRYFFSLLFKCIYIISRTFGSKKKKKSSHSTVRLLFFLCFSFVFHVFTCFLKNKYDIVCVSQKINYAVVVGWRYNFT